MKIRFISLTVTLMFFVSGLAFAGTVNLPKTGQTTCYNIPGSEIPCPGTGQDGEIQAGVAWPEPRFTDNGDGTMTDNLTGLMWTKNASLPGTAMTWQESLNYVSGMNGGTNPNFGYNDWRLPDINELESLNNQGWPRNDDWLEWEGFVVAGGDTWSSTTSASNNSEAWTVSMRYGFVSRYSKSKYYAVWPVRAGQQDSPDSTYPANIWKTGQTTIYVNRDDGDIKAGVAWPNQRFTVIGDCVIDNLTGLMWTKTANLPGVAKSWQEALDYVKGMNTGTNPNFEYTDWRLPNRKELYSLTDFSKYSPALASGHPFIVDQSGTYWSSTSGRTSGNDLAWYYSSNGTLYYNGKTLNLYVWPVRTAPSTYSISGSITGDVQTDVTVSVSGDSTGSVVTDSSGNYTYIGLIDGSYTITPEKSGYIFTPSSKTITVAGANQIEINFQAMACIFTISSVSQSVGSEGGTGSIIVTASKSNCPWAATSNASWVTVTSGSSGTGNGMVNYSVSANSTTTQRIGTLTVAGQTFTVTQQGITCSYSISPTNQSFDSSGGTGSVDITSQSGCAWTATSNDSWITITSGSSGTGNGTVTYTVSANTTTSQRTGTMTIAGQTFTVTEEGLTCTYTISPTSQSFNSFTGTGSVDVTTQSGCTWTATSNDSWIAITSGSSGTGNGTVNYSVSTNTGSQRTGTITIAGQTFTVTQEGITECSAWDDVIAKYQVYVIGHATWSDVITCYNEYASSE